MSVKRGNKTIEEELQSLREQDGKNSKCVDMNYMVYNYGKFHANAIN